MKVERRRQPRVPVDFEARWEGSLTRHAGTITDISPRGCFLLTSGDVQYREFVRLEIMLPTGRWIYIWGEVVNRLPEIGFGLRFTGTAAEETEMLSLLLDYVRE